MSEADDLRKAMGKKIAALMAEQRAKFLAGAKGRGVKEKVAERVFELMEKFAGYGFNKAHATAYGIVAYQTAYFKANYPVEFMAALLTSEMANTDKVVVHMDECRAMGIGVLPPDVNVSRFSFGVDGETIRFGLGRDQEPRPEGDRGHRRRPARQHGAFASLADFCRRLDLQLVNRRVVESLVKAGAFDSSARPAGPAHGRARRRLRRRPAAPARARPEPGLHVRPHGGRGRRAAPSSPTSWTPSIAEWDTEQRLLNEKEVLGLLPLGPPAPGRLGPRPAAGRRGHRAARPGRGWREASSCAGSCRRSARSTRRTATAWASRPSRTSRASIEVTIFPELFRQSVAHLRSGSPLLVRGKLEGTSTARKILADDVRPLPAETEERGGRHRRCRAPAAWPCPRTGSADPLPAAPGDLRGPPRNGAAGPPPPRGRQRGRRPLPHPARAPVGGLRRGRGGAPGSGQRHRRGLTEDAVAGGGRSREGARLRAARSSSWKARIDALRRSGRPGIDGRGAAPRGAAPAAPAQGLREAHGLAAGPARPPPAAAVHPGPDPAPTEDFVELHGDRLFGDDHAIVGGLAPPGGPPHRGRGPPEGPRHRGEAPPELRDAAPGGLPEGAPPHAAGRALPEADPHAHRHPRRLPRRRRRGARPGRGDRRATSGRWPGFRRPSSPW